jgi:putative flavoprotein involved in K+ transport
MDQLQNAETLGQVGTASMDRPLDAAVIGAGWAGLGVSYALAKTDLSHRVLERGRIGETWLTQRWDSFYLNTSKLMAVMPGDRYEGPDPEGFYTRDEFVALLEDYARRCRLPVATNTPVTALKRDRKAGVYRLITPAGELTARAVVIASGSLNRALRPEVARALPPGLLQIDASVYRSPDALPAGAVLVVGSAQSGGQIAEDLAMARRVVFLSTRRTGRKQRRYRGRDVLLWELDNGQYDIPRKEIRWSGWSHSGAAAVRRAPHHKSAIAERAGRCATRPLHWYRGWPAHFRRRRLRKYPVRRRDCR